MDGSVDIKFSFSLKGRMSRAPYIIVSLIYFAVSLFVATQVSLSAHVVIEKFLSQAPGLRAAAIGHAHASESYRYDAGDNRDFQDSTAGADAGAMVYVSDADARDVKSNYALMYQAGIEQALEITLEIALTIAFVVATSNRFHDMGQPGFFAILLFVPVPFVLWLFLILAPPRDCPKAPEPENDPSKDKPVICGPIYIKNDHSVHM